MTLSRPNDMRNAPLHKATVDSMRRVRKITSEIAAVNSRLEANASPQLAEKAKKALSALDAAAPTDAELFHMDHGMYGMVKDSPIHGVTPEAHLIRQMGGHDAVSQKARVAESAVREFESELQKETSVDTIAVTGIAGKILSVCDSAVSILSMVAKTVAVAWTGAAAYLLASQNLEAAGIAAVAAIGGVFSIRVLSIGQNIFKVPEARQRLDGAQELQKAMPELKKSLEAIG